MKTIWMVNHSSHTPAQGKWTRHYHLGRNLLPHGWQTRVITASVDRHGVPQPLAEGEKFRHEDHDGVAFTLLRTPEYKGHGFSRVRNMLAFMMRALDGKAHAGLQAPDVVVGCTVHPFAALAGALLARRYKVPFFFEVRDLWPETLIQFGLTGRRSPFALMLGMLEKYLYRRADRIISTLPNIGLYLERHGLSTEKVRWITNGIDFTSLPAYEPPPQNPVCRLLYIGSLAYSYGLETLIEAMVLLKAEAVEMELVLVGDGELRPQLERMVTEAGLENVTFHGPVSRSEVPAVAAGADAFVMLVRDLPELYCYGISMNKLTEYLALGRPVVISVGEGVNNMVAEADAGFTAPPENPQALAAAMARVAGLSPAERQELGLRGRKFAQEKLDYAYLAGKYAGVLEEFDGPKGQLPEDEK